jgi:hypothetical protein
MNELRAIWASLVVGLLIVAMIVVPAAIIIVLIELV